MARPRKNYWRPTRWNAPRSATAYGASPTARSPSAPAATRLCAWPAPTSPRASHPCCCAPPPRAHACSVPSPNSPSRRGPLSTTGPRTPGHGPRAGDRLPDVPRGLQQRTAGPGHHLLLTGPWPEVPPPHDLVAVHHLGARSPWQGTGHALVRPDGYVGYTAGGTDLTGLRAYLDRWLPRP
ncbi:hypothetical protein [Streptomyces sp. SudanB52_2052]|uniref:aromatic-ring hydroxylase C-terminal domain-containing protein n=1 Tax=Streptomyces sp. SudanB52_2052 TaxID=3035276 RepID=UPI003F575949